MNWREHAACPADLDPDAWFPSGRGASVSIEALELCESCEVSDECLAEALSRDQADDYGVWGGVNESQRRRIRAGTMSVEQARDINRTSCKVDGCPIRPRSRGMCDAHYSRWLKHGDPQPEVPVGELTSNIGACEVDHCERDARARGWCEAHYRRWQTSGDVKAHVPIGGFGKPGPTRVHHGCEIPGCDNDHEARGLCRLHYQRQAS